MKRWWPTLLLALFPLPAAAELEALTFITEEYPPYNYRQNERLEGISIELLERIFAETGSTMSREDVRYYPWARGYETVLSEPNTVLFSTTRTEQREQLFQWVGPIATDRVSLLARRDSGIQLNDIEDVIAGDYRIAVIREDIGAQRLQEAEVPEAQIHAAMSGASALRMLERGRVDLWAYGEDVAFWLMNEEGMPTTDYTPALTISESDLYYALHRDTDPDLIERMQAALDRLRERGVVGEILGGTIAFNTEEYPPYNYRGADGTITGSSTELLRAALSAAELDAEFRLLPWARAYTEAQLRERHCVYSTTRTPEREALFTWVGPLTSSTWAAFTLEDAEIEASSLEELAELRVGSFREDAVGQYAASQGVPIVVASAERENIARLRAGVIDAWVTGEQAARYLAEEANLPLRRLFVFNEVELYLACHPSVPDYFIARLQAALDRKDNTERPL
ncbi:substrate-binding periplasmic protein [Billgrantia desiderata]|uniref:substrate-binding periplasmic protein n=1 Tax=Billgrantia desiderata TaxID=52021 RepID=UPI00089F166D|nr:transporter substrate-binding domain-containing protein [Halomonas desiderata]SEG41389.1 polar amino acid transport system substrate-binding protein [Halomonas desiderata]